VRRTPVFRLLCVLPAALVLASLWAAGPFAAPDPEKEARKPQLRLRANPSVSFAPVRVVFNGDLVGGADDDPDFYCTTVSWEWGDGTESENTADCDPYQAGKSQIRRRFVVDHVFRQAGNFRVLLRLKRGEKQVAMSLANVQVRPGFRDPGGSGS